MHLKVGIQGNFGSVNHRAAELFAERHAWRDYEVVPLTTTENVLRALANSEVDFGTFAWESTPTGPVAETQEAVKKYTFNKVDELDYQIDHALLQRKTADITASQRVFVYSHPQALKSHRSFLERHFAEVELRDEIDSAYAAEALAAGRYPSNSLVIARVVCADMYGLAVLMADLPTNADLVTKIFLVRSAAGR